MKKKTTKKPASKAQGRVGMNAPIAYHEPKCVRIEKAGNGLTVRSYGPKGEQVMVAKSDGEAMRHAKKMLGE